MVPESERLLGLQLDGLPADIYRPGRPPTLVITDHVHVDAVGSTVPN
jgi:hypothetical protein